MWNQVIDVRLFSMMPLTADTPQMKWGEPKSTSNHSRDVLWLGHQAPVEIIVPFIAEWAGSRWEEAAYFLALELESETNRGLRSFISAKQECNTQVCFI